MSKQTQQLKGKRFREALLGSGLTGSQLARILDLQNDQNITNWKARGVPAYMVGEVARTLIVEREWLEGRDVPMRTSTTERNPGPPEDGSAIYALELMSPWDPGTSLEADEVELRLYREVEFINGPGKVPRAEVQETTGPKLRFSRDTMRTCGVDPRDAVFAMNHCNSTEPLILVGATVGIDTGMTRIVDGEMYAIDHNGQLRIKFVEKTPSGITLKSFNSKDYADEDYDFDEIMSQRFVILGRIFWWSYIRPLGRRSLT